MSGTQLSDGPALSVSFIPSSPLATVSVDFADSQNKSVRTVTGLVFEDLAKTGAVTAAFNTTPELSLCRQRFSATLTWSQLTRHAGAAYEEINRTHIVYKLRVRAQWNDTILYSDGVTIGTRASADSLPFHIIVQRAITLQSGPIVLLDSSVVWAVLLRSEFDTASRTISLDIETRVVNGTVVERIGEALNAKSPNLVGVRCQENSALSHNATKFSQLWQCTVSVADRVDSCYLVANDEFLFMINVKWTGPQAQTVAPMAVNITVDLSGSENLCPFNEIPNMGADGVQYVYTNSTWATVAQRYSVNDTVFLRADIRTVSGVGIKSISVYKVEIAGTSVLNSYLLVAKQNYSQLQFKLIPESLCPTTSSLSSSVCLSFVLERGSFADTGNLLIACTYDVHLIGVKRSVRTQANIYQQKLQSSTSIGSVHAGNGKKTTQKALWGVIGALAGVIAACACVVIGVTVYKRITAPPARPPRSYANL
eukprot:m51a1_g72 hypothetical protein (481) ;mRNA; r:234139-235917